MIAQTQTLNVLLDRISGMSTVDESNQVRNLVKQFKEYAQAEEYDQVRKALSVRLHDIAAKGEQEITEVADLLRINGVTYDLSKWLTISSYAKKYGLDTHVITNWIRRETIPNNCVIELPLLNNIRMIKDQSYR